VVLSSEGGRRLISSGISAPKSTYLPVVLPAAGPVNSMARPSVGNALCLARSASMISGPNAPANPATEPELVAPALTAVLSNRYQYRGADFVISAVHVPGFGKLVGSFGFVPSAVSSASGQVSPSVSGGACPKVGVRKANNKMAAKITGQILESVGTE